MKITHDWKVSGQQVASLSFLDGKTNHREHNSHGPRTHYIAMHDICYAQNFELYVEG